MPVTKDTLRKDGLTMMGVSTRQRLSADYLVDNGCSNSVEGYQVIFQQVASWSGITLEEARAAALEAKGPHTHEVIQAIDYLVSRSKK